MANCVSGKVELILFAKESKIKQTMLKFASGSLLGDS